MTMIYRATSLLALAAAATAMPALAQEGRETHFDGPYVSVAFGLAAQGNDAGDTLVFDTDRDGRFDNRVNTGGANAFVASCPGSAAGATLAAGCRGDRNNEEYVARIGYDTRAGGSNFVIGNVFEFSKPKAIDYTTGYSSTPASYTLSREIDYALSLRARVGYTPNGGALFYATGGASYAKIKHGFSTTNTANSFTAVNDDKHVWGLQAGGGAEIMLTDNISMGFEYLYNHYKDHKYYVAAGANAGTPATNPFLLASGGTNIRPSDTRFAFHSLRTSLSFQF